MYCKLQLYFNYIFKECIQLYWDVLWYRLWVLCPLILTLSMLPISRRNKIRFSQFPPSQRGCRWCNHRGAEALSDSDECANTSLTLWQWKRIPQLEASILCIISGNQIGYNHSQHSSAERSSWKRQHNSDTNGTDSAQSFNSFHEILDRRYTNQLPPAKQNAIQCI